LAYIDYAFLFNPNYSLSNLTDCELYQGGVNSKIKNKVNEYAIGLYSDYHDNKYEVTVGNEVSKAENSECVVKVIPAGKYAKFSITGHVHRAVAEAWEKIWSMEPAKINIFDFGG